jgi:alternate signal-mediated exported protein
MKNKKPIIAGVAAIGVLLIGCTAAYFTDEWSKDNHFQLGDSDTEFIETFDSPTNWKSCDVTPKELVIKNKSGAPVTARFKMEEYWKVNGSTSEGKISDLSLDYQGERVAIINFKNEDKWELRDGWYTYKTVLQPGDSTDSLLESVTFNCNQNFSGATTYSDDHKTGTTQTTDYQNARYHLFITAQTNQATGN